MKTEIQDEVIEELWKIKDHFCDHGKKSIQDLVKEANQIAKQKGFKSSPHKGGKIL